ncbi:MAG TPA: DNA gyrase C-terminal beta-propeller domain-containing protein, partial [Candidatus Saccharimonadales bacterium]|nr:DNA gyrase C-terminal beta-propeller domain-containing protein [Candidatus Saccharimonadales bacterium]
DEVVEMDVLTDAPYILTVTAKGFGKRSLLTLYRKQTRGGYGIIDIRTSERNGKVAGVKAIHEEDQIMLISIQGMIMRMRVKQASIRGRGTQGVRLINLDAGDELSSVAKLMESSDNGDNESGPGLEVVPPPPDPEDESDVAAGDDAGDDEDESGEPEQDG